MNAIGQRQGRDRHAGGFSVVEVIVLIAVVALLTGVAVPLISGHYQQDRRQHALGDIRTIGQAMASFYRDLGTWPARRAGFDGELYVLCSGDQLPKANPFTKPHQLTNWLLDGLHGDLLRHHLVDNRPCGNASGAYGQADGEPASARWRGPYLGESVSLDPWGRPYLVTVVSGSSTDKELYKRLFVLSAGPNGEIDTNGRLDGTTDVAGDDLGMIVSQRR